ncbi:MAG: nucleotide exchange factor GrpE [Chloroflexi bacterium]|nr:nucleotide exchange factor GrpE [Chloroflexota bacterium]
MPQTGPAQEGAASGQAAPQDTQPQDSLLREMEATRRELQELRARADRLLANWQRAQADLANYRKQAEREREDLVKLADAVLISRLLAVVDDLERALTSVAEALAGFTWVDGIWLIYRKFQAILEAHGVTEIKASEGQPFDPQRHQAVMETEGDAGKVVKVMQKGYLFHQQVLRPVLVMVGKGQEAKPAVPQQETRVPPEETPQPPAAT